MPVLESTFENEGFVVFQLR